MSQDRKHLLVVDDDSRLRDLLSRYLTENGFLVTVAMDAAEARAILEKTLFDLIILDIMMPGESGLEFSRSLSEGSAMTTPILFLTALTESENRIEGLESGGEDYLGKPFEPKELLLRIQKILNRVQRSMTANKITKLGQYSFNTDKGELSHAHGLISLTTAESNLLKILSMNPGRTISRDELAARTGVTLSPRTIDVQVTRLRRKIEPEPRQPKYLKTIRHKGYVLWPG